MAVAGVLFDFDGVLADSLGAHLRAWSEAYQECFKKKLNPEIYRKITGHATSRIAGMLAAEAGERAEADKLMHRKNDWLRENSNAIPLFPGVKDVFSHLRSHSIPFAIASNAPVTFIEPILRENNLKVDVILGRESVPRPKPAPDIYLLAARMLGIHIADHEKTVVFEDSIHGLNAAVSAKMYPIGITSQAEHTELVKGGARETFPSVLAAWESKVLLSDRF